MKKQARSYPEMQFEGARLDSGWYRLAPQAELSQDDNPILAGFKRAAYSLGLDIGKQVGANKRFEIRENDAGH
jgi:hypothetical protein